jgi:hypothetical protein
MAPKKTPVAPVAVAASASTKSSTRSPSRQAAPVTAPVPVAAAAAPAASNRRAKPKAAEVPATTAPVAAPKKRASKASASSSENVSPAQIIVNSKPATHHVSGETVTLTKTKRTMKPRDPNAPPRQSAYNQYMKVNLAVAKEKALANLPEGVKPDHKLLFKQVASAWKNSAEKKSNDAAKSKKVAA